MLGESHEHFIQCNYKLPLGYVIKGAFELNLPALLVTDFNKRNIIMVFDALFGTSAHHFDALHIHLCTFGLFDELFSTGRSPEKSLHDVLNHVQISQLLKLSKPSVEEFLALTTFPFFTFALAGWMDGCLNYL